MDPAAFHDDLTRIPEQLSALARTARSADDAAALIDDERAAAPRCSTPSSGTEAGEPSWP